jgi:LysR family glycine cleavage system transcriptional activator
MRTPNLNSLKMFDAAARHLNFRLAAEELNVTQGAVAQQVRRLEEDLGAALFHREARGLSFTGRGREFHGPVRKALFLIEEATRKFAPDSSSLTMSVTPSFASKWLVPRLGRLAKSHPEFEVQVVASEELANFKSDGVDLAIRQGRLSAISGFHVEKLGPMDLCAVCSPAYAANIGPVNGLSDILDLQLIRDGHNLWEAVFEEAGLASRPRMLRFNQIALAVDAAANGQGIALAPRLLIASELKQGKLTELWQEPGQGADGFYLVYPENNNSNPALTALVDWILAEVNSTVEDA